MVLSLRTDLAVGRHRAMFRRLVLVLLIGCACGARGQTGTNELRTWTSKTGQTLAARFVARQGDRVRLETAEGAKKEIVLTALSAADQQYIEILVPPGPKELLPGTWLGTGSVDGSVAHFRFSVKPMGNKLTAQGILSIGLSQSQVAAVQGRRAVKGDVPTFARLVEESYDVLVEGDAVSFKAVKSKSLFEGEDEKDKWIGSHFAGTFFRPGIVAGVWKDQTTAPDAPPVDGVFYFHKEHALDKLPPLTLAKGVKHELPCLGGDALHYTCYIPQKYDPAVPAPVLVNKDPGGNGQPLSTKMAEEYGWIMVGLKESSNTERRSTDNCVAALFDLRRRFNIDMTRVYFSGLSGRARQSGNEAIGFPDECAGLILIGAGFAQHSTGPRRGQYYVPPVHVPIFFLVGTTDMNNAEVTQGMVPMMQKRHQVYKLKIHPGGHDWGRAEDHEEAIRWLDEQWKATSAQRRTAK